MVTRSSRGGGVCGGLQNPLKDRPGGEVEQGEGQARVLVAGEVAKVLIPDGAGVNTRRSRRENAHQGTERLNVRDNSLVVHTAIVIGPIHKVDVKQGA